MVTTPFKVIQGHKFGTNGKPVCNFLWVSNSNLPRAPFRDMADYWSNFCCRQGEGDVPKFAQCYHIVSDSIDVYSTKNHHELIPRMVLVVKNYRVWLKVYSILSVSQLPRNTLCWQRNLRPMKTSSSQKFALSVPGNCKMRYLYAARLQAHFRLTVAETATAPRC